MSKAETSTIRVRVYLTLAAISGAVVGFIVWGGIREVSTAFIWAGITFIVVLVAFATFALALDKEPQHDPDQPRLK
jgi:hypothetical protein